MGRRKKASPGFAISWIVVLLGTIELLQNLYVIASITLGVVLILITRHILNNKKLEQQHFSFLTINELRRMDPFEFEEYIRDLLIKLGYKKARCTSRTGDEGRDIDAIDSDGKYVQVECKRYGENNVVGRPKIQILHSSMIDKHADRGIFVTTSRFSKEAMNYAKRHKIEVIDETKLTRLIAQANDINHQNI